MKISELAGKADILIHVVDILKKLDLRVKVLEGESDVPAKEPSKGVLRDMFGVNAYSWNFLQDPKNVNVTNRVFEPKFAYIKSFTAVRHYLDRILIEDKKELYTFNPTHRGSWYLDSIFEACHKADILNLVCLKGTQHWIYGTWPEPHDDRNIPAVYGLDLNKAESYPEQAKLGFQFSARYGRNKDVPKELVRVNNKPRWTADPVNEVKIGLGTVTHIEAGNEQDLWWLEGKRGYQTGRQAAALHSAFYDGHKGTMGADVGVKTADPTMQVVMAGLATASVAYVREMVEWCRLNRGVRPDGYIDLCWDIINYHHYSNDGDLDQWGNATKGIAPEKSKLVLRAKEFVELGKELGIPVWQTETGYDIGANTPQRSPAIGNKSAEHVQADWTIRTALLYARLGIERLFYYQLYDDSTLENWTQYSSSGLAIYNEKEARKRPSLELIDKFTKEIGDYSLLETISNEPEIDVYVKDGQYAYVCWIADEVSREMRYRLVKKDGVSVELNVTETPIIVR